MSKEYKYPKNWFKYNLVAVPAGVRGNCSACVFRNAPGYCKNMSCTYIADGDIDTMISVYWLARETHANVSLWAEFRNWFDSISTQRVRDISNDVMTMAVKRELEKTR